MRYIIPIFFLIIFIALIYQIAKITLVENWQDYTLKPYYYIYSGRDPLYFYRYDRYRRPYRDGFLFYQSYPIPHMTNNP